MGIWLEIVTDLFALLSNAFNSPKGLELLDEIAQALGLPDVFPEVDGYQGDNKKGQTRANTDDEEMEMDSFTTVSRFGEKEPN